MKTIALTEAKAHLRQYGMLCYQEPVLVTVDGVPLFQLVPPPEDDDHLTDNLIEHNADFRKLLEDRANDRILAVEML